MTTFFTVTHRFLKRYLFRLFFPDMHFIVLLEHLPLGKETMFKGSICIKEIIVPTHVCSRTSMYQNENTLCPVLRLNTYHSPGKLTFLLGYVSVNVLRIQLS